MEREPIRVLVVDENQRVRTALAATLSGRAPVGEVRAVGSAGLALAAFDDWQPDIVLLEVKRGDGRGPGLCRTMAQRGARVLVITTYANALEELELAGAGACGYLLKDANPEQLLTAVVENARLHPNGNRDHSG